VGQAIAFRGLSFSLAQAIAFRGLLFSVGQAIAFHGLSFSVGQAIAFRGLSLSVGQAIAFRGLSFSLAQTIVFRGLSSPVGQALPPVNPTRARLKAPRMKTAERKRIISLALAILAIAAVLALSAPSFFSLANQRDLALANMPVLIVALGMVLVILTGQIDISVGSQFAICSVAAGVFARMGMPTPLAGAAACAVGAAMGAINGALVAWVRIPSIVVTLATMVALRDGLRWGTQGAWVQDLPPDFQWFGRSQTASEAITVTCALVMTLAMSWGLRNLAAGRIVYATGSDAGAARLAGIRPQLAVFLVFVALGALTGFAAVFNAVRFHQIPSNAGIGLELKVIAAAVVGGVAIAGGRGTIAGMLLGLLLLGMIGPALTYLGFSAYWERAIEGAIILAAVALDALRARGRT
jgi:rhamnose transport system permease protein